MYGMIFLILLLKAQLSGSFNVKGRGWGEGYFHGKRGPHFIKSLNPSDGSDMDKPAAPAKIRAFLQAAQEKNKDLLNKLAYCFGENTSMRRLNRVRECFF